MQIQDLKIIYFNMNMINLGSKLAIITDKLTEKKI